jgi:hypothetical protein
MRIQVPDAHQREYVALAGTPPNANETRLGAPREEDVRVSERYPRNIQVRRTDDGQRYVGVNNNHAEKVLQFFEDEYGVVYDDGEIVGLQNDEPEATEPQSESKGKSTPAERPAEPENTADAHWNAVKTAIESGAYDDSLDTVAENDDRQSIQTAIEDRKEVLD